MYLRPVPMSAQSIGAGVLVGLAVLHVHAQLAPGTTKSRLGVNDNVGKRQPRRERGGYCQQSGGRIASRAGYQSRRGESRPRPLGKPIDGFLQQGGGGVLVTIPARVERGIVEAESGRQIYD